MDAFLSESFERLMAQVDLSFTRYLYRDFKLGRLTGLIGARGVGKTTLMLQYIKEHLYADGLAFYFSADAVYFNQASLLKYVNDLYHHESYRLFFIDEIHKYNNWQQELKNLYDAFPDIKIVYSGSSMLEIKQGSHDLSRRAMVYHLAGMSFREYYGFVTKQLVEPIETQALFKHCTRFNQLGLLKKLSGHFKNYLATGYYPFIFEDAHGYYQRVMRIVDKIIFEDIPNYYDLKTHNLHLFKRILAYLASISPGEVNTNNIASHMGVAHTTVTHYLAILESVGLIQLIYPYEGGSRYLRKPQKIFLHNTSLLHAIAALIGDSLPKGTVRELFFMQSLRDAGESIYYAKQGDYRVGDYIVEIGGKNKTAKQLTGVTLPSRLVKDDILSASSQVLPLAFFGFLY